MSAAGLYCLAEGRFFNGLGLSEECNFLHLDKKPGRVARWKYVNGKPEYLFVYSQKEA